MITSRYLSRAEAVQYIADHGLPLALATLAKYATIGGGPAYHRWGARVAYSVEDLDRWIAGRLGAAQTSTADTDQAA